MWVCGSCPEVADGGDRPRNTLVLAGPDGTVHRYRKIHRFAYGGEHRSFDAGADQVTVDVEGLRVSLFVCYDLRFADEFWAVAPQTDVYVCVANWPEPRRAALVGAAAGPGDREPGLRGGAATGSAPAGRARATLDYAGDSAIVDPLGEALATGPRTEALLVADVTAERVAEVRKALPFLADRADPERSVRRHGQCA